MARCECPEKAKALPELINWYAPEEKKAMYHEPNECPGDYQLMAYKRKGEIIWLCSCCTMPGDTPFEVVEEKSNA